jgi:hypothetical protein
MLTGRVRIAINGNRSRVRVSKATLFAVLPSKRAWMTQAIAGRVSKWVQRNSRPAVLNGMNWSSFEWLRVKAD